MTDGTVPGVRPAAIALTVAGAATLLSLGLRVEGSQLGRTNAVRVFLVAALALIAMSSMSSSSPSRARTMVLGAMAMLGLTIALIVGNAAPQGLVVLLVALAALTYVRNDQRRPKA